MEKRSRGGGASRKRITSTGSAPQWSSEERRAQALAGGREDLPPSWAPARGPLFPSWPWHPVVLVAAWASCCCCACLTPSLLCVAQVGKWFAITERGSTFTTELRAGTVTFLTVGLLLCLLGSVFGGGGVVCVYIYVHRGGCARAAGARDVAASFAALRCQRKDRAARPPTLPSLGGAPRGGWG